jgi:hypothetical protein
LLSDKVKVVFSGIGRDPEVTAVADVDPCDIVNMRDDPETRKSKHDQHLDPVSVITVCACAAILLNAKQSAKTTKPTIAFRILIPPRRTESRQTRAEPLKQM